MYIKEEIKELKRMLKYYETHEHFKNEKDIKSFLKIKDNIPGEWEDFESYGKKETIKDNDIVITKTYDVNELITEMIEIQECILEDTEDIIYDLKENKKKQIELEEKLKYITTENKE